jgi:hypothetical protein
MNTYVGLAAAAVLTLTAGAAHAAKILAPISVAVNSGGAAKPYWAIDNIIDQSGLTKKYTAGVTEFEDFTASDPRHGDSLNTQWTTLSNVNAASITFDFGKEVTLASLAWWDSHATRNALIRMSTPTLGNFKNFAPIEAVGTGPKAQVFDFQPVTTRYLTFEFEGCLGGTYTGCGLQEVVFAEGDPTAVPEPATWAMMILGFGAAGSVLRRRRMAPQIA